jgi:CMP-N,N'-diacetyllegionaminic acid synthase
MQVLGVIPGNSEQEPDAAIELLEASGADSVVSVVEVPYQFNPVSVLRLDGDRLRPFLDGASITRRQGKPRLFARSGPAILAVRASVLGAGSLCGEDCRPTVIDVDESLDIDTPFDVDLAEWLLSWHKAPAR